MKYLFWPFLRLFALVLLVVVTIFGVLRGLLRALSGANQIPPSTSGCLMQVLLMPIFLPIAFVYFVFARLYLEIMVIDVKLGFSKPEEVLRVVANVFPANADYWHKRLS